jgi:hypothetical protein
MPVMTARAGHSTCSGSAPQRGFSVGALALSIIFTVLLITAPQQLDAGWQWIRDLPLVLEVVAWIALLPWLLAYLAWQTTWPLWIRVVAVWLLVGGVALSFWKGRSG